MAYDNVRLAAGVTSLPQLLSDVPDGLSVSEAARRVMGAVMQVRRGCQDCGLGLGGRAGPRNKPPPATRRRA